MPLAGSAGTWTKDQPEAARKGTKMKSVTRKGSLWMGVVVLVTAELSCGCQSSTGTGALAGGALGAGIGALAGGRRNAGVGALAGGLIGAGTGAIVGNAADRADKQQAQAQAAAVAAAQANPPLSLQDVVTLTANGSSDEVIINQIRTSGSVYQLTAQDIVYLQNNGVRQPIITEMQATAYRPVRRVYTAVPATQPVYVYPAAPPPPVGFGVTYVGGRWR